MLALRPGPGAVLLLLGPFVAVPLALGLACPAGPHAPMRGRWRLALLLCVPLAVPLLVSYSLPTGVAAAAWALPWLAYALLVALLGVLHLLEHELSPAPVATAAGLAYLSVGAFWLAVARWGAAVGGFGGDIPFLTAAHFHFAGLVVPVLAGTAARALPGRWSSATALALVFGMPLVAVGVTLQVRGHVLPNAVAATLFAMAGLSLAGLHAALASGGTAGGPGTTWQSRVLWAVSAVSLAAGMLLAVLYATGLAGGPVVLTVPQMVRTHAVLNVAGFAMPALLAWHAAPQPAPSPHCQLLLPGERLRLADWRHRSDHAGTAARQAADHEDHHEAVVGHEPPGPPLPDGPFARAAQAVHAYRVFPPRLLRPVLGQAPVETGDVVGAEVRLVPGLRAGFASRVTSTFHGSDPSGGWRSGFTYRTLAGHPECGEETFCVRKDGSGVVRVSLTAWSRPGHWTSRAVSAWARRKQLAAGRAALAELQRHARGRA